MTNTSAGAPMPMSRFLSAAGGHGRVVGVWPGDDAPALSAGVRWVVVDAAEMSTIAALFDEFSRAWGFPGHFGRNKDAFDDCMRDLAGDVADGHEPSAYVTVIVNAEHLLRDDPDELRWFASSLGFYRDHYRDVARPTATFAAILVTAPDLAEGVETCWRRAGSPVAILEA
ncbi:barstar family protein [Gordonia rhizosphera]|nr:barstar family protein [Gordonia rhizosphera]